MEHISSHALQSAISSHRAGDLNAAEHQYRAILAVEPDHPHANHNLGVIAINVGKPELAVPFFKRALDADERQKQFWLSYINALIVTNREDEAKNVLQIALSSFEYTQDFASLDERLNGTSLNINKQAHARSKSQIRPQKSSFKGQSPNTKETNALVNAFATKDYPQSARLALALTQKYPRHFLGYSALGATYKEMGLPQKALAPINKAISLAPKNAESHNNLGQR